jgi:hypothetical protein
LAARSSSSLQAIMWYPRNVMQVSTCIGNIVKRQGCPHLKTPFPKVLSHWYLLLVFLSFSAQTNHPILARKRKTGPTSVERMIKISTNGYSLLITSSIFANSAMSPNGNSSVPLTSIFPLPTLSSVMCAKRCHPHLLYLSTMVNPLCIKP